ncbi:MAG: efflux RND transporter periplasmic adaptor subunit [Acidobacteria bacterium]|nr:efflux RND transporter periplasmic adaptor subunit [Acidobacteriota bacterium]
MTDQLNNLSNQDSPPAPAPPSGAAQRGKPNAGLLTRLFLGLILLAAAALVAWQFYGQHLEKITSKIFHRAEQVKNGTETGETEVPQEGHSGMAHLPAPAQPAEAPAAPREEKTFFVSPQQQQLTGVTTVPAQVRRLEKELRTAGKITYDERRVTHIHTKVSGWLEQVFVDFVGKFVKAGDPLFTIYSPELVSTQEEYLLALRARKDLGGSPFPSISRGAANLVEASRHRLQLWDVSDREIEILETEGKARREITVYSQVTGFVTERAAYHHGRYVTPEMDLYMIADLSSVWVIGEVYEYDLPLVREGQQVTVEMPNGQSPVLTGTVSYVYPYLSSSTRTGQIRMEFSNPSYLLKPNMFVNVKLKVSFGAQLTVPEDALLDTGMERLVFVDRGNGYFEPRQVETGEQAGGFYAIKRGLKAGERVATAANFILDSESRLKTAFANMGAPQAPQPVTAKPAQQLRIQLRTEPEPAKVGDNRVRVKISDDMGTLIPDAVVRVRIFMPAMGSMPPMSAEATLSPLGGGEYSGTIKIPMAWTWQTTVSVERQGQLLGSGQFNITAR